MSSKQTPSSVSGSLGCLGCLIDIFGILALLWLFFHWSQVWMFVTGGH